MTTETVTNQTAPWAPLQPYLTQGFAEAQRLYGLGGPQLPDFSAVAPFGDVTQQALGQMQATATQGSGLPNAAVQQAQGTLSGQYLPGQQGGNPYLDAMYQYAAEPVTRNYQEAVAPGIAMQYANAGRTGSGLYQNAMDQSRDTLARNLSGMASNMYGQAFEGERNRQIQALGMAPQTAPLSYYDTAQLMNVGQMQDTLAQQQLAEQYNRAVYNQELPWDVLGRYQNMIRGQYGGQSSSQYPIYDNSLAQNIGLGLAGASLLNNAGGISALLSGVGDFFAGLF